MTVQSSVRGAIPRLFRGSTSCVSRSHAYCQSSISIRTDRSGSVLEPRWYSNVKSRLGRCITFGMTPDLVDKAGRILHYLSENWKELVAGSEGFLTDQLRAGLYKQSISWGEQDAMGHVNNVQYVRYAESGRTNWIRGIGQHFDTTHRRQWEEMLTSRGVGLILKSITVDYKFPLTWPDRVSVYHKFKHQPDATASSLVLDVLILSESKQRAAAKCLEDCVVYDYKQARKTVLAPFMLEQFAQIWALQETAKRRNKDRIATIEQQVRQIEQQSWDRSDAKEDLGTAA